MNSLSDGRIAMLASAYQKRMSLRTASSWCGVNRETALRYFRHFSGDAIACLPRVEAEATPRDILVALADSLASPDLVARIDGHLKEIAIELEELMVLKRIAVRIHASS